MHIVTLTFVLKILFEDAAWLDKPYVPRGSLMIWFRNDIGGICIFSDAERGI